MKKLIVRFHKSQAEVLVVGTLAEQDRKMYFEYDASWIESGLQLSPFKLPLQQGLFEHTDYSFGSLPGVFDDSLPDGWGLLLMDKYFRKLGVDPAMLSPLDRLSYVGTHSMGALTYHPSHEVELDSSILDLHALGKNAEEVFAGSVANVLPELERAGGTPGGARPKVLVGVKDDQIISGENDLPSGFEHWLIKFASREELSHASRVEYAYSLMAKEAGISFPESRLFDAGNDRCYFGVKRFDREERNKRKHVHTFANLIHTNFRIPSTDYVDLFKVTQLLTRNHQDIVELFRRMVFNVASHNRDDHAKNFAFMMDEHGQWGLTPAYDLTFTEGIGGEHTMSVLGEGMNPSWEQCVELAAQFGVKKKVALSIIEQVKSATHQWKKFANTAKCSKSMIKEIAEQMNCK